ncbi:MAG: RnfABCDGE type electron transport complex subunit A [Ruminococcaceae bacterium]|nr:RnfABCDGE type electron transport complex subunit A [Oscillospiraceae bacterium]
MKEILLIAFAAIITENFIFSRFLGICPFLGVSEKPSTAAGMGFAVMFVMAVSSALTWLVYKFILVPSGLEYIKTIAFILIIAALVQIIEMFLKKFVPALYQALGIYLPLITTNCAVLGAALLNIQNGFSFIESVVFGLSAAVGFTMALLIFAGVRERLRFATPPAAFKGIPLLLLSAGLIAMAFSGFSGISL